MPAQRLSANALAPAEQPCRNHARIVQHHELISMQQLRKLAEFAVVPDSRFAPKHHHARRIPLRKWPLRDSFSGQLVVEILDLHFLWTRLTRRHTLQSAVISNPRGWRGDAFRCSTRRPGP